MVLRVLPSVRIRSRPHRLVGDPVEVVVGGDTASDLEEQRECRAEAAVVVAVEAGLAVAQALAAFGSHGVAYSKCPISSEKATSAYSESEL
jgi:hypothetical protein